MENFYLTLPSNTRDFDSNTTAEFRVRLPNPLELDGDWEVGLVEIQYPFSWNNLKGGHSIDTQDNWILVTFTEKFPVFKNGMIAVKIPPGYYGNIESMINAIEKALAAWTIPGDKSTENPSIRSEISLTKLVQLSYDTTYQKTKLKLDTTAIKGVVLGSTLQYMLGFGGEWSHSFNKSLVYSTYPPDLTAGFNTLFVYCNIIQPQIVGNTLAPLLRTVPISGSFGSSVSSVFLSPHYIPLRNKSFETVEISIKDDQNHPIEFNFGKVILKLHFKKKEL